jgi:hypothetical protein
MATTGFTPHATTGTPSGTDETGITRNCLNRREAIGEGFLRSACKRTAQIALARTGFSTRPWAPRALMICAPIAITASATSVQHLFTWRNRQTRFAPQAQLYHAYLSQPWKINRLPWST